MGRLYHPDMSVALWGCCRPKSDFPFAGFIIQNYNVYLARDDGNFTKTRYPIRRLYDLKYSRES